MLTHFQPSGVFNLFWMRSSLNFPFFSIKPVQTNWQQPSFSQLPSAEAMQIPWEPVVQRNWSPSLYSFPLGKSRDFLQNIFSLDNNSELCLRELPIGNALPNSRFQHPWDIYQLLVQSITGKTDSKLREQQSQDNNSCFQILVGSGKKKSSDLPSAKFLPLFRARTAGNEMKISSS